jgi:hypothetical protein
VSVWPSALWAEAIWASNLKPAEKLVALAYADHARSKRQAWLSYQRLMERTGYSRSPCAAAVRALREAGWLKVVEKGRQHKSTVYELTTPTPNSPDSGLPDVPSGSFTGLLSEVQQSEIWESSSPAGRTPPIDTPIERDSQYLEATAKAQRREGTSQVANAAFSPRGQGRNE